MPFAYYHRLSAAQKKIYRQSDQHTSIILPRNESRESLVEELSQALKQKTQKETQAIAQSLMRNITDSLQVPRVRVEVLLVRPSNQEGELHGLYHPEETGRPPR